MGEVADYMIEGEMCQLCGQFFTEKHGYPVICKDCWVGLTEEEKKNYEQAIYDTL
jgi:hypothetical protein